MLMQEGTSCCLSCSCSPIPAWLSITNYLSKTKYFQLEMLCSPTSLASSDQSLVSTLEKAQVEAQGSSELVWILLGRRKGLHLNCCLYLSAQILTLALLIPAFFCTGQSMNVYYWNVLIASKSYMVTSCCTVVKLMCSVVSLWPLLQSGSPGDAKLGHICTTAFKN